LDYDTLRVECQGIRASILRMAYAGRTPHVASAFPARIFWGPVLSVLKVDPEFRRSGPRPVPIEQGHACMAQYAALAAKGSSQRLY